MNIRNNIGPKTEPCGSDTLWLGSKGRYEVCLWVAGKTL